jgi:hypothetical protein
MPAQHSGIPARMDKHRTLEFIKKQQRQWADSRRIRYDSRSRVLSLPDNLFSSLNPETVAEYQAADGDELGRDGKGGKLWSLHSSSALVCNVFDYWRNRNLAPLGVALGVQGELCEIRFERKFPTGLRGKSPNLDLILYRSDSRVTAIESKFTEPYCEGKSGFVDSYFDTNGLWEGLDCCRGLAEAIHHRNDFEYLGAPQLLKHILGLRRTYCASCFELLYLWYDVDGSSASSEHAKEFTRFQKVVSPDVYVRGLTYSEVFRVLLPQVPETDYAGYLKERYVGTFH